MSAKNPSPEKARQWPAKLNLRDPAGRVGRGGLGVGHGNSGRDTDIGIAAADLRHHVHVLGPTGTGKSTLLLNMMLDDATNGRGLAVLDPKGDLIRDLLDRLPADCADRLVIIDPDDMGAPPALNLLAPGVGGGTPYDVAAHITSVMARVWSRWWGHRTADVAHHAVLTLAHLPGTTLADLPRLLSDAKWRAGRVNAVIDSLAVIEAGTLAEFWEGFDAYPPGQRGTLIGSLLSRLRLVMAHPLAASLFGVPVSTFRLADILDGGILLCRLPKGVIGEDGTRLIGSLLLAGLWQATTARARQPESSRLDARIVVDECHNFLHLPIGVDDALAEARGLRTSFVLAHQYLGQLSGEMAEAIDANARNKIYFALAPKDATDQVRHVRPFLDDGDLTRLGGFEIALRPVAGGVALPVATGQTYPAPPVIRGRADQLREAAAALTGLAAEERRAARLQAAAPADRSAAVASPTVPTDVVGRDTFRNSYLVDNVSYPEGYPEFDHGDQDSFQHSPLNTPYPQLSGGEEDR
ncbi:hypothetical protein GCM10010124_40650 [Pilimelia terevasa]|uniref:Type IV secretion system coupling protein TraD DNA-binding domain-containing protein n=1 Tax=Pilimelia terevasa TaxID=53372 RepID=A0A8J3FLJ5_9ACTN|nr:type IV secretion system DNA-binding domain-containing protein [Pilimelia terevasa]GGK43738.1 hypothetical protein GCM10010124_40650 [Pilimelia terevasa]